MQHVGKWQIGDDEDVEQLEDGDELEATSGEYFKVYFSFGWVLCLVQRTFFHEYFGFRGLEFNRVCFPGLLAVFSEEVSGFWLTDCEVTHGTWAATTKSKMEAACNQVLLLQRPALNP